MNMWRSLFLIILLASFEGVAQQAGPPPASLPSPCYSTTGKRLVEVKRIYVESFGEDPISKEMQSMVVTSLTGTNIFSVTENKAKADAILKGTTVEKTSQEAHSYSDATSVGTAHSSVQGSSSGSLNGYVVNGTGAVHGSSSGSISGHSHSTELADATSTSSVTTVNDARASVRLVNSDDDVIWTTTQESKGAKYKGASADVADKIVKQLLWDVAKATPSTK